MTISPEFGRDLAILSRALGDPTGLVRTVTALEQGAMAAVSSYLGLRLLLSGPATASWPAGPPLSLTTLPAAADLPQDDPLVASSLLLPLVTTPPAAEMGSPGPALSHWWVQVVLYAARPGAFVDLAADLAWLAGTPLGEVEIDQHLTPQRGDGRRTSAVSRASTIDQALGVLLARGFVPARAVAELERRAALTDGDVAAAAQRLLRDRVHDQTST